MHSFESLEFYRGVSAKYASSYPQIIYPRQDRKPRDSSREFHDVADAWFEKKFAVKYRSRGVFVTSKRLTAQAYAASPSHVMRVIPTSTYSFCWAPNVSDLYFASKRYENANSDKIEEFLNEAEYREGNLLGAYEHGCEVMLFCAAYVAIPALSNESGSVNGTASLIVLP